jgi:histidine triad (HIT) family protein
VSRARAAGCTFCAIAAGERPAERVLEDERFLAFLDHRPLFPGHVLLVPRAHRDTLLELPPEDLAGFLALAQRLCRALEQALSAEGTFVAVNNRVSQSVPHLHLHVVPRRRGDGLRGFFWPRHAYRDDAHRGEVAAALRRALAEGARAPDRPR